MSAENRDANGAAREVRSYFVDEAGDPNVFSRKGKPLVGTTGCSRFFIVGLLEVCAPGQLGSALDELRSRLLADPYFADVPSMQPDSGKTAVAFHAKDDLPEVRREVFRVLRAHEMKFLAIVRDKREVLRGVKAMNRLTPRHRYKPDDLYDDLVKRLFRDKLHIGAEIAIHFAMRGSRPRTKAFGDALAGARRNFYRKWGIEGASLVRILPGAPAGVPGLQAADYFLWSLQRFYEREEDRYLKLLWPQYRLVIDLDDKRDANYGTYYSQKRPLTRAALDSR